MLIDVLTSKDDKCKVIKGLLVVRRYIGDMHILNIISQGHRHVTHIYTFMGEILFGVCA